MIHGSACECSTIFTLMKVSQEVAWTLQRDDSVIIFDLAIYMKAKQIQLKFQEEYKNTVTHMDGFHKALYYLSLIGKKYAYSGLKDLLIESGVYTAGTTSVVMLGKSYNRGIGAHSSVWRLFLVFSDKHFCSGWKIHQGRPHWQLEPPLSVHSRNDSGGSRPWPKGAGVGAVLIYLPCWLSPFGHMEFLAFECIRISRKWNISEALEQ